MNKTKNLKIKYNKYLNNFNFKNTFFPTYTTLSLTENSFKYTKKNQKILGNFLNFRRQLPLTKSGQKRYAAKKAANSQFTRGLPVKWLTISMA